MEWEKASKKLLAFFYIYCVLHLQKKIKNIVPPVKSGCGCNRTIQASKETKINRLKEKIRKNQIYNTDNKIF